MKRKTVSGMMLILPLIGMLTLAFNVQSVKSGPRTWTVDDDGPADFSKIQDAINAASDGDTIFVYNGTYYENVIVNKSVSLVGESRETTIIDGGGTVDVILIKASEVLIVNFTVRNCGLLWYAGIKLEYVNYCNITNNIITNNNADGVWLEGSSNNRICSNSITANRYGGILLRASSNNIVCLNNIANNKGGIFLRASSNNSICSNSIAANGAYGICLCESSNNSICSNSIVNNVVGIRLEEGSSKNSICSNSITANIEDGIYLWHSSNNIVCSNNVTNNGYGAFLRASSNNRFRDNAIANSKYNFGVLGSELPHFTNDVDTSNTINGKPIYYIIGRSDLTVPSDAGYVALVNCTNIKVENLNLKNNFRGVLLYYTKNSTITQNNIANNRDGVGLQASSNNIVRLNNITANNYCGVRLGLASNNTICSNCITANNWNGVNLFESSNNSVFANNITANNYCGVRLHESSNNSFYHNNFVDNKYQARVMEGHANTWDDGYPSGGNYWSGFNPPDRYSGPFQNESGWDGIGDAPYVIDERNVDRYPLIFPYGYVVSPDLTGDGKVDIDDVIIPALAFASYPGHPRWNPIADVTKDGKVDIDDVVLVAIYFGQLV